MKKNGYYISDMAFIYFQETLLPVRHHGDQQEVAVTVEPEEEEDQGGADIERSHTSPELKEELNR